MNIFQKIAQKFFNKELEFQTSKSGGPGGQNVNPWIGKLLYLLYPQSGLNHHLIGNNGQSVN